MWLMLLGLSIDFSPLSPIFNNARWGLVPARTPDVDLKHLNVYLE